MAATYELLVECPPFSDWPLPEAHEVRFEVRRFHDRGADACKDTNGRWVIRVNENFCGTLTGLLRYMMHEICHVAHGEACPNDSAHHGKWFKALAAQVCREHVLDPKAF